MRQIGSFKDEAQVRTLADYLLTQKIETHVEPTQDEWELWARDEDQLALGKSEMAAFKANPEDPRYREASRAAETLRRAQEKADANFRKQQIKLNPRLRAVRPRPVTLAVMVLSLIVAALTGLGTWNRNIEEMLFISPAIPLGDGQVLTPGWHPVLQGEVWRLLTPMLLHFSISHLVFNLLAFQFLAGEMEALRGSWRVLIFLIVTAAISNVAQYVLGGLVWNGAGFENHYYSGGFGGLSGVCFALFGYEWMKVQFEPQLGFSLNVQTITMYVVWLFLCMTGAFGPIANVAHASCLIAGLLIGVAPTAWRMLLARRSAD